MDEKWTYFETKLGKNPVKIEIKKKQIEGWEVNVQRDETRENPIKRQETR